MDKESTPSTAIIPSSEASKPSDYSLAAIVGLARAAILVGTQPAFNAKILQQVRAISLFEAMRQLHADGALYRGSATSLAKMGIGSVTSAMATLLAHDLHRDQKFASENPIAAACFQGAVVALAKFPLVPIDFALTKMIAQGSSAADLMREVSLSAGFKSKAEFLFRGAFPDSMKNWTGAATMFYARGVMIRDESGVPMQLSPLDMAVCASIAGTAAAVAGHPFDTIARIMQSSDPKMNLAQALERMYDMSSKSGASFAKICYAGIVPRVASNIVGTFFNLAALELAEAVRRGRVSDQPREI